MAGEERRDQNRELVLPPDSYLYLQNIGKGGLINVYCGPTVVNQTGQDQPVRYDPAKRSYQQCSLEVAVQNCPRADQGDYVQLENPAENNNFPDSTSQQAAKLRNGRKLNIPGPWCRSLWPGQSATVIEGHQLRSNQYLVATVYDAEEAEANWANTIVKGQTETDPDDPDKKELTKKRRDGTLPRPESFAVGTRIVIKGSDVSFFIPATGISVVRDEKNQYVRDGVTLEQLEYCCLIDESGKKLYPKGPAVVFPSPTQVFEQDKQGRRKFRPIELNTINGIHLKVTCSFEDEDLEQAPAADGKRLTRKYNEGEELFVTGKTLSIYYPREQFSVIEYGQGKSKHFSTAIPKGEGRYVIDREKGMINLVRGPRMLLPDPRYEIQVRRILSDADCELMYPGNVEALQYNRELAQAMAESPSGRSGIVSEGDYRKQQMRRARGLVGGGERGGGLEAVAMSASLMDMGSYEPEDVGEEGGAGGTITRGTKFTQPKTLTLNTKYDGVPRIEVWPGYAVLVVGAEGSRRVVEGPEVILLEYDERLGFMRLSTGKPKSTDTLYKTAYLKVTNNQVGDIVGFESSDHVKGTIKISMRVNFEAADDEDKLRWWGTDNYVKYLTDHVRSIIAGMSKKKTVAEIKSNYVDLVRNAILGDKKTPTDASESLRSARPGLFFADNGMRVVEVEVLEMTLADAKIAQLLDDNQHKVVENNIQIEAAQRDLEATVKQQDIARQKDTAIAATTKHKNELDIEINQSKIDLLISKIEFELKGIEGESNKRKASEALNDITADASLARAKKETEHKQAVDRYNLDLKLEEMNAATDSATARFTAAKDGLYDVLISLNRDDIASKLAEACTIERFLSGDGVGNSIANLLSVFPTLKAFVDKATAAQEGRANGNRLTGKEALPKTH